MLLDFPVEIALRVLSFLPEAELFTLAHVNSRFIPLVSRFRIIEPRIVVGYDENCRLFSVTIGKKPYDEDLPIVELPGFCTPARYIARLQAAKEHADWRMMTLDDTAKKLVLRAGLDELCRLQGNLQQYQYSRVSSRDAGHILDSKRNKYIRGHFVDNLPHGRWTRIRYVYDPGHDVQLSRKHLTFHHGVLHGPVFIMRSHEDYYYEEHQDIGDEKQCRIKKDRRIKGAYAYGKRDGPWFIHDRVRELKIWAEYAVGQLCKLEVEKETVDISCLERFKFTLHMEFMHGVRHGEMSYRVERGDRSLYIFKARYAYGLQKILLDQRHLDFAYYRSHEFSQAFQTTNFAHFSLQIPHIGLV